MGHQEGQGEVKKPSRFDGIRNEWYTPVEVLEAAYALFSDWWELHGVVGHPPFLDPFSAASNPTKASEFFTVDRSAYENDWPTDMPIWINPPFSQMQLIPALERFSAEVARSEHNRPALLLLPVNNRVEQLYYQQHALNPKLRAMGFFHKRLAFRRPVITMFGEDWQSCDENLYAAHILAYNVTPRRLCKHFGELCRVLAAKPIEAKKGRKNQ